jgi:hypothetical protein
MWRRLAKKWRGAEKRGGVMAASMAAKMASVSESAWRRKMTYQQHQWHQASTIMASRKRITKRYQRSKTHKQRQHGAISKKRGIARALLARRHDRWRRWRGNARRCSACFISSHQRQRAAASSAP